MIWNHRIRIKRPDWFSHWHPESTFRLYKEGKLPEAIAGQMLVIALKHGLRCVYGSDLKAAWSLLFMAVYSWCEYWITEPLARAWYRCRYGFAWFVCEVSGAFKRRQRWRGKDKFPIIAWGRHESPEPLLCLCGWGGMRRWAIHGYQDDGTGEAEPVDECPRCGTEI